MNFGHASVLIRPLHYSFGQGVRVLVPGKVIIWWSMFFTLKINSQSTFDLQILTRKKEWGISISEARLIERGSGDVRGMSKCKDLVEVCRANCAWDPVSRERLHSPATSECCSGSKSSDKMASKRLADHMVCLGFCFFLMALFPGLQTQPFYLSDSSFPERLAGAKLQLSCSPLTGLIWS